MCVVVVVAAGVMLSFALLCFVLAWVFLFCFGDFFFFFFGLCLCWLVGLFVRSFF